VVDEHCRFIEMDYGLVDVFCFWEFEVSCLDIGTNSGGILAEHVNMFL